MHHPAVQALIAFAALTCALALWKGGRPERIAAAIIFANLVMGFIGDEFISGYRGIGSLVLDALVAFGFLGLTVIFGFPWLGVAMLIYALQFALHAFYFVTERSPHDLLHATINNVNFLGVNLCLLFGTVGAIRRRQVAPAA